MPEFKKHTPGSFCWAEVGTVQTKKTKAFYAELFGWTYEDKPAGQFGVYTMCKLGGKELAGLFEMPPEMTKMGVPPHWMSYIAVENADASAKKIQQHGGKVQQGPFDVMDVGRMAVCQDPTGAMFSIWQPKSHKGAGIMGEHGTPCWFELATKDVAKAEAFYKAVFGWSLHGGSDGMVYRELTPPGANCPQGGIMELLPQHGPQPPNWKIYFTVADCDADAKRAQALGGRVYMPPMDIPKVGRFAVLADPAGASFAIITLSLAEDHKSAPQTPAAIPSAKGAPKTDENPKAKAPAKPSRKK
jgi:uncharacterized protein